MRQETRKCQHLQSQLPDIKHTVSILFTHKDLFCQTEPRTFRCISLPGFRDPQVDIYINIGNISISVYVNSLLSTSYYSHEDCETFQYY